MEDTDSTHTDSSDWDEMSTGCPAELLLSDQVSVESMDVTKGRLDEISRPASGAAALALSEIRRMSRERPGSLEPLSPDLTHTQGSTVEIGSDQEASDEEHEDPELGEAIKRMKKLDRILAFNALAEREVKKKGRTQHQRLWQELQAVSPSMSSHELENTKRFLALTPDSCCDEEDFFPVFETEVLDLEYETNTRHETDEHAQVESVGQQVMEDQTSDGRRCGKRRQDFVKRNIELAGVQLTHQQRERIQELLRDTESDLLTEAQAVSSSLSAGEGFSPEPSERNSLLHIDSRLQLLLPVWDFLSVRSRCSEHSLSEGSLEDSGDRNLWDTRHRREERLEESQQSAVRLENTGDRVLWDMRQRREEEKRLQEIQQQLELLEESQQSASEDQLRNLLLECEEEVLRSPSGSSCDASLGTISALLASPCLCSCDLTEILTNTLKTP